MFKKMMLILLFCVVMFNLVYANGKQVEDIVLKKQIRDFLVKRGVEVMKNSYGHLNLFGLKKMNPQKTYKDYEIYRASIDMGLLTRRVIMKKNDNLYLMSNDFNKLLIDSNNLATKENELAIAEKYVELCTLDETIIEQSELKEVHIPETIYDIHKKAHIHETIYDIQIISWTKINGVIRRWNFTFKDGQIHRFAILILDMFKGDYILDEDLLRSPKGSSESYTYNLIHRTQERTESVTIKNHSDEEITFTDSTLKYNHTYVVVKDDGISKPPNERTVTIELSDFIPLSNVDILITIKKDANTHTLFNQVIPVNASGNANYNWEIPADVHTGKCKITANGGNAKYFFIYRTRSDDLPEELNYDYRILYGDQFANFNEPVIETFADNVTTSILDVYQEEINNWNFPSPKNIDLDEILDIYVMDSYSSGAAKSTSSDSLIFEYIVIGFPFINYLKSSYNYSTDLDAIGTVLCHEFLHSVQYHYPNIFLNWESGENKYYKYISEGQARFIQTVYMKYHSSTANNEEFAGGRHYQYQANQYLLNDLNLSLKDVSYDYCLFWRFLYENYKSGTEADSLDILIKLLEESDNVGNDPIIDGEIAFNNALSSGGGLYNSMDEVLITFSKNVYFNDPVYGNWNPDPSDDFYINPHIETTDTLTFDVRNSISILDTIPSSFGIDYHQININNNVNAAAVKISVAETNRADFGFQVWAMQDAAIVDSFSVVISESADIATVSFRTLNTANKFIINVVRLDANEDDPAIDSTYTIEVYPGTLVSGNQSGNWVFEDSPYLLDGNVTVPAGQTLNIAEGISVFALDDYAFTVNGVLNANGIEGAMVKFSSINTTTGWQGIKFINNNRRTNSELHYTIFEYGRATGGYPVFFGGAVYCDDSSPVFEDCLFQHNTADGGGGAIGLYNWSSPTIRRTRFVNNSSGDGGAIYIWNPQYCSSFPLFEELIFENNTASNSGGAINCYKSVYPVLINCTFNQNYALGAISGGALYCYDTCNVNFFNTIMWQDTSPELYIDYNCSVEVHDCDLTEGENSYILGQYSWITFEGNILESDPQFVDGANGNYNLKWTSPCIDMGSTVRIETENRSYQRNRDDDGTLPDIGARYYYQPDYVNKPTDLTIFTENDSVYLDWNHGDGAIFYKIYESLDPYNSFAVIDSVFGNTEYSKSVTNSKNFYKITGANNRSIRGKFNSNRKLNIK
jgi:predicted outer membrane repeat protein